MTSVFDDNIISINYKYFASGHGKIGDYLIYQKIDLLGVVKEFTIMASIGKDHEELHVNQKQSSSGALQTYTYNVFFFSLSMMQNDLTLTCPIDKVFLIAP